MPEPCDMGRRMQDAVAGIDPVDIDEVARGHRQQVAVTEHRALGAAGGAARVEEPRRILRRAARDRPRFERGEARIVCFLDGDDRAQMRELASL